MKIRFKCQISGFWVVDHGANVSSVSIDWQIWLFLYSHSNTLNAEKLEILIYNLNQMLEHTNNLHQTKLIQ